MSSATEQSKVTGRFSPEFRLVLLCLRWPYGTDRLQGIASAASEVRDWKHLHGIAHRHRVAGLVFEGLSQAGVAIPEDAAAGWRQETSGHTRTAFVLAMETARLSRSFAAAGIRMIVLKGSALTAAIYGNASLRFSKDVDLLVAPEEVGRSIQTLLAAGFLPLEPISAQPAHLDTWLRYGKAMDWISPANGVFLELHWRLTDLPLLRLELTEGDLQQIEVIRGAPVSSLRGDMLIAYLCVHGSAHGWGRLKWLADVYALLPQDDPEAIEALYRRTSALDAGRAVALALLLCHSLLGLPIGRVQHLAEDDTSLALLRWSVRRMLQRGGETAEVHEQPFGTTGVYLSRFLLGSGSNALLSEARTWTHRPKEVAEWRLPQVLLFLLPLKRLFRWLDDRVRHGGRSSSAG